MKRSKQRSKRLREEAVDRKLRAMGIDPRRPTRPTSVVSERALKAFYKSWEWARLSYETRKQRGNRCECCGATPAHGVRIVCDHVQPLRKAWDRRLDQTNLQVLCDLCNRGKASRDATDWRSGMGRMGE